MPIIKMPHQNERSLPHFKWFNLFRYLIATLIIISLSAFLYQLGADRRNVKLNNLNEITNATHEMENIGQTLLPALMLKNAQDIDKIISLTFQHPQIAGISLVDLLNDGYTSVMKVDADDAKKAIWWTHPIVNADMDVAILSLALLPPKNKQQEYYLFFATILCVILTALLIAIMVFWRDTLIKRMEKKQHTLNLDLSKINKHNIETLKLADAVIEGVREGIILVDRAGVVTRINLAALHLSKYYQAKEIVGKDIAILSQNFVFCDYLHGLAPRQMTGKCMVLSAEGDEIPVRYAISPIHNADNVLTHYAFVLTDQTQLQAAEEKVNRILYFDPLTQMPNRLSLAKQTERMIEGYDPKLGFFALVLMDIDSLQSISDSYGRKIADLLLLEISQRLRLLNFEGALMGRDSDDEFLLVTPYYANMSDLDHLLGRLKDPFRKPFVLEEYTIKINVTVGVAIYPDNAVTFDQLWTAASTALHSAKALGRGALQFYSPIERSHAKRALDLEHMLITGIEKEEFELFFQPQIDVRSGLVSGAEVLIRWNHPKEGLIMPNEFIPLAEHRGLIVDLTRWIIHAALKEADYLKHQMQQTIRLSINISPSHFRLPTLIEDVERALKYFDLDGSVLDLEITEGVLVINRDEVRDRVAQLAALDISVSIDDFGMGYSSLAYLKDFKASKLKIDRTFIKDIPEHLESCKLSRMIVNLAQDLGMKTVAEGVETKAQWDYMMSIGCDAVQGYFVAKPLNKNDFRALLVSGWQIPSD
jgi:diguanylate cyclase (GGDEF)-like protein